MNIKFKSLILKTKRDQVTVRFSQDITYFYGQMGAGKSTIPRLIDYCLGAELKESPALQSEYLSVQLELEIGKYNAIFLRGKKSDTILVTYESDDGTNSLIIPSSNTSNSIEVLGNKITNVSDLIFILSDLSPPKVTRSKLREDSEVIRLSFRDIMWYCYLDQDHIDSSFFYLGREDNVFKQIKSKDVLMYILDYNQQTISQIRTDLANARQEQQSLKNSSIILKEYLQENGINTMEVVIKEKERYEDRLYDLNKQNASIIRELAKYKEHPLDQMKLKARSLSDKVDNARKAIENYDFRINEQTKLKNEFITSQIKSERYYHARKFFKDVEFHNCPQCGLELKEKSPLTQQCYLCKQFRTNTKELSYDLDQDLKLRISELDDSIEFLRIERTRLEKQLCDLISEKNH